MRLISATTASLACWTEQGLSGRLRSTHWSVARHLSTTRSAARRRRHLHCRNDNGAVDATTRTGSFTAISSASASLVSIADQYDGLILDQFGVLHDGSQALPGAVAAVEYLYRAGKKLMILSNTSAPAAAALARLPKYGFRSEWFDGGAVTSGEEASKFLSSLQTTTATATEEEKVVRVLFWTWDDRRPDNPRVTAPPRLFLERSGPHVQIASSIDEADYLLLHGSEVWNRGMDVPLVPLGTFIETGKCDDGGVVVDDLLRQCAERRLPMICANPDEQVVTPTGGVAYMPGGLARRYMELCDQQAALSSSSSLPPVEHHVFGKPDPRQFRTCANVLMGEGTTREDTRRIVHVGDSMHHDIVGATQAGLDTLFITSGIHAPELGVQSFGEAVVDGAALVALYERHGGVRPTHVLPAFCL
jgi:ribonucleotide monophosphatase NagD (HAD superfamily)